LSVLGDPGTAFIVLAIILIGGTVKGALGIGLPAVAMSLLPIVIDPALAVTILSVPILVTNAQQVVTVRGWPAIAWRFRIAGLALFVSIFGVSLFLDDVSSQVVGFVVGISLSAFALAALFRLRLPLTEAGGWQVLTGVMAGITGGLSSVKAPVMIYCAALDLPRREFVVSVGFLFFVGGLGLVCGLSTTRLLTAETLPLSLIALAVAMLGFQAGTWIGRRVDAELFRRLLLGAMLLLGLRLIIVSLL